MRYKEDYIMKFSDMGLSVPHNVVLTKVKDQKFTVKQYLPAEDKNAILEIAMQQADQGTHPDDA